jgi:hypothetical protein
MLAYAAGGILFGKTEILSGRMTGRVSFILMEWKLGRWEGV